LGTIIHKQDYRCYFISALTELGFAEFLAALAAHARHYLGSSEPALVTRDRHRRALADTVAALGRAAAEPSPAREDIVAEELRLAARALGRLTGRVDVEDILDVIFRDFCIGK
jgi:tRNA modification GTPase